MKRDSTIKFTRRSFLSLLGLSGIAAASAVAIRSDALTSTTKTSLHGRNDKGYQLTPHIRQYYRTTLV